MEQSALAQTLDCGQCFRWKQESDGSFTGMAGRHSLHISESNFKEVVKDRFWGDYFDVGLDYGKIRENFRRLDPELEKAVEFAPDIRILNQEPWEAMCSFIISQCNNIGRIKGIIARLCASYGEEVEDGRYAFPGPEKLAGLADADMLRLGCGFRAPYIIDAAQKVVCGMIDFGELKKMPLGEARKKLTEVHGIGPKVADCTLLYGLHRLEAFPMDVWMKRAMKGLFPGKTPEYFGGYAGIAQQYIYYYSRSNPGIFNEKRGKD